MEVKTTVSKSALDDEQKKKMKRKTNIVEAAFGKVCYCHRDIKAHNNNEGIVHMYVTL